MSKEFLNAIITSILFSMTDEVPFKVEIDNYLPSPSIFRYKTDMATVLYLNIDGLGKKVVNFQPWTELVNGIFISHAEK